MGSTRQGPSGGTRLSAALAPSTCRYQGRRRPRRAQFMTNSEWISVVTVLAPIGLAFGVVQVRMHSAQQGFTDRINRLERSEDQQNARQTHMEDAMHALNAEVKAGF